MNSRTHVIATVICVMTILLLGASWFAFGQKTNAPAELTPGMEKPLVQDIDLEKKVANLTKRMDDLEAAVDKLEKELNGNKQKTNR